MNDNTIQKEIHQLLTDRFGLAPRNDKMDFINHLALRINDLIVHDMEKLIQILYRIDIDENQLREMISKYVYDDAGYIIAQLVIDRELRKLQSRKDFKPDETIPEDDRW